MTNAPWRAEGVFTHLGIRSRSRGGLAQASRTGSRGLVLCFLPRHPKPLSPPVPRARHPVQWRPDFPEKKAVERPAGIRNGCALRGRAGPEPPEWPPPPGHAFILTSTPCLSLWPPVPLVPSLRASSRYSLTITGTGGYVHPCGRVK